MRTTGASGIHLPSRAVLPLALLVVLLAFVEGGLTDWGGVYLSPGLGSSPELAAFAVWPARILTPLPALSVLLSYQRAVLVLARRTRPITVATAVEVATIAALFVVGGWIVGMVGVTAAFLAFLDQAFES